MHVITLSILTYSTTSTRFTSPFNIYVFSHQDRIPLSPKMFHQLSIDSSLLWCICCGTTCDYWRLKVFLCLCLATTPPSNENIQSPCAFPLPQDSSLPTNVSSEHTFWTIQCALLYRNKRSDQLNSNHSIDLPSLTSSSVALAGQQPSLITSQIQDNFLLFFPWFLPLHGSLSPHLGRCKSFDKSNGWYQSIHSSLGFRSIKAAKAAWYHTAASWVFLLKFPIIICILWVRFGLHSAVLS